MKKQYSAKQKAQIVKEIYKEEKSIAQLSAEYGIHPNQLYRWRAQAEEGLPGVFEKGKKTEQAEKAAHEREKEELYAEIGRLTTQLTWLKKKSGLDPLKR
jgi:putative transposase